MYQLKGFIAIQALADNNPGSTSPIGELSTYSKTFSREIGYYSNSQQPDVDLLTFVSETDGEAVQTPAGYVSTILQVGQWIFEASVDGRIDNDEDTFASALLAEYQDQIDDLVVGEMIESGADGWAPEWIQFTINGAEENYFKLWLSDGAFSRQYDEYEMEVVPPVDVLDDLFKTPIEVKALLDELDDSERMHRIQVAKDRQPDTITKTELYEWSNPLQPEITLTTAWTVIIYGPAGNNLDAIRRKLQEYILENSEYPETEWEKYLPDIFKVTEFILTPLWDNYSIPNETLETGLHSPTVENGDILRIAYGACTRYDHTHIDAVASVSVSNYRSIAFIAVGGPENKDGVFKFKDQFPDYIVIPTTSSEFGRMSPETQEWVMLFSHLLKTADSMSEYSEVPIGMSRLERDGVMYTAATYNGVQYLVTTRESYTEIFDTVLGE